MTAIFKFCNLTAVVNFPYYFHIKTFRILLWRFLVSIYKSLNDQNNWNECLLLCTLTTRSWHSMQELPPGSQALIADRACRPTSWSLPMAGRPLGWNGDQWWVAADAFPFPGRLRADSLFGSSQPPRALFQLLPWLSDPDEPTTCPPWWQWDPFLSQQASIAWSGLDPGLG